MNTRPVDRKSNALPVAPSVINVEQEYFDKLAPCGTNNQLFATDVSAKFKVT